MSLLGLKASFIPYPLLTKEGNTLDITKPVTGKVVYENRRHKYFTVEYQNEGVTLRESFKFCQIKMKEVTLHG